MGFLFKVANAFNYIGLEGFLILFGFLLGALSIQLLSIDNKDAVLVLCKRATLLIITRLTLASLIPLVSLVGLFQATRDVGCLARCAGGDFGDDAAPRGEPMT